LFKPLISFLSDLSPDEAKDFLEEQLNDLVPGIQILLGSIEKCSLCLKKCDDSTVSLYGRKITFLQNAFTRAEGILTGRGDLSEGVVNIDDSKEGKLGEGSFGVVKKGDLAGTPVAVKTFKKSKTTELDEILAEAEIMKKIRHPNIVRFIGAFCEPGSDEVKIVSELCDGDLGRCAQTMRSNKQFEANVAKWFCQAARGLAYMHDVLGMVHCDIKPANILLRNGVAQIADFGFTLNVEEISSAVRKGTPAYVAPELWESDFCKKHKAECKLFCETCKTLCCRLCTEEGGDHFHHSLKLMYERPVDVYAFGMSMYTIFSGIKFVKSREQIKYDCVHGIRPDFSATSYVFPPKIQMLIEKCWDQDPEKRPTMQQVHDRLKEIYVELLLPPDATSESPAFKFWMSNFGNELVDSVSVFKLLGAIPNGLEYETSQMIKHLLQKDDSSDTVSLRLFNDMRNWYDSFGVWYEQPALDSIIEKIESNQWFVGYMNQDEAEIRICLQWEKTKKPCFLVRCSSTNSRMQPYTITFHDKKQVQDQRVDRVENGDPVKDVFVCTHFSTSIVRNNIFDLVDALFGKKEDHPVQDGEKQSKEEDHPKQEDKKVDRILFEPYDPIYAPHAY